MLLKMPVEVSIKNGVANVYANNKDVKKIIGKGGKRIAQLEREVGIPIEVFSN
jgi:predicted PilT family ATPase